MTTTVGVSQPYYGQPVDVGTFTNVPDTTTGLAIKSGGGVLYKLVFNKPVATGVITLYDGTSTGGKVIGIITIPASPMPISLEYNAYFATGLFIVVATAAQDLTVIYK